MDFNQLILIAVGIIILIITVGFVFLKFIPYGQTLGKKYLPSFIQKFLYPEGFDVLAHNSKLKGYIEALEENLTFLKELLGANLVINEVDQRLVLAKVQGKAMEYYKDDMDFIAESDALAANMVDWTMSSLTDTNVIFDPELRNILLEQLPPKVISTIKFKMTNWQLPKIEISEGEITTSGGGLITGEGDPIELEKPKDIPVLYNSYKKPINAYFTGDQSARDKMELSNSYIIQKINEDHKNLGKGPHLSINSSNLITGIRSYGFNSSSTGGKKVYDERGRPKAQLRYLAALTSTKDPNSIARYAGGSLEGILNTGKGFGSMDEHNEAIKTYMENSRNEEYRVFKNIRGRFIDHKESDVSKKNSILRQNIINDIIQQKGTKKSIL
jgi:hypothetical protein